MRKLVRALIYKKWFYAFLATVLWFDCYTDVADVIEAYSPREVISLIMSTTGVNFIDNRQPAFSGIRHPHAIAPIDAVARRRRTPCMRSIYRNRTLGHLVPSQTRTKGCGALKGQFVANL